MKNKLTCLLPVLFLLIHAEAQIGFEQYFYVKNKQMPTMMPICNYKSSGDWYAEARYNYEEMKTFSFYGGKVFSQAGELAYAITPMLGGVVGKFKGISSGLNVVVEYKKVFFAMQSQYTVSFNERNADFFFSWSELGYEPWKWFYFGLTAQHTYMPEDDSLESDPGLFIGFTAGMWTFPLYVFRPLSTSNYLVMGVNLNMDGFNRNK